MRRSQPTTEQACTRPPVGAGPGLLVRLACAVLMLLSPIAACAEQVVFAASSLKSALDEVAATYSEANGRTVVVSYAGSSALARQLQYGAQADLFISANPGWMDVIEEQGLIAPESRVNLLGNRLVLIAGHGVDYAPPPAPGFGLADALQDERLAMALVDAVPAGIYGREALMTLGVWSEVAPLVAQTDNVRAALKLVAIGEAPLGIVYESDATAESGIRVVGTFPEDSHAPILYPAAILNEANGPEARALLDYLSGPKAREIFLRHGFTLPEPSHE